VRPVEALRGKVHMVDEDSGAFDVVVVGGGLAGASLASVLARAGLDILVLEREVQFRDRVRGEWLAPWGLVELEALGLRQVAESVSGSNLITKHVAYDDAWTSDEAEADVLEMEGVVPGGGCLGLSHPDFQEAMLANAVTEGATVVRGTRTVEVDPGTSPTVRYEADDEATTVGCRLVVAADGRESQIRKGLGIELESTVPQFMMGGMLVEDTHDWPSDRQSTGVSGNFHFLVFPQADNRVRLYGGWDVKDARRFTGPDRRERFLESFRMACLPIPGALADGRPAGPLAAYQMTDTWTDVVASNGVVLIGDAAGWSDPVIGQGMAVTFRDVHMVSDIITNEIGWSSSAFGSYAKERRERMRRLRFASAAGYLRHGLDENGAAQRRRFRAAFAENPGANPAASALLGAWFLPEEAYSDEAWNALKSI
jgi:2-polyprenyl-6-methoxyphenol hydroxylase-like FAD-dependent oxidoreductase